MSLSPSSNTLIKTLQSAYDPDGVGKETNPAMYTNKSLLRRESIKFSPRVLAALSALWDLVDEDRSGTLEKCEYETFHDKLTLCLAPETSKDERREMRERDWTSDSGASSCIARASFYASMHELADLWTSNIAAEDYARFLNALLDSISFVREDGVRVYKLDDDVVRMGSSPKYAHLCKRRGSASRRRSIYSDGGDDDGGGGGGDDYHPCYHHHTRRGERPTKYLSATFFFVGVAVARFAGFPGWEDGQKSFFRRETDHACE